MAVELHVVALAVVLVAQHGGNAAVVVDQLVVAACARIPPSGIQEAEESSIGQQVLHVCLHRFALAMPKHY